MLRVLAIFLFSSLPAVLCAQDNDKKKANTVKKPAKFKVIKLSEPVPYLGKFTGNNEIQKTELLKADSIQIKHCFNLPSDFAVLRYRFSAMINGQYFSYTASGPRLTREIKDALAQVVNGTKIKFSAIAGIKKNKKDTVREKFDDIVLKVIDNTDTSLITYKLKNKIPEPGLFSIKKQLPQKVSKFDLLFVDQLFVKCDCKIPSLSTEFSVIAFDLHAYHLGNKMIYSTYGPDLTREMRDALAHAKSGTKFRIENIQVRTADGIVGYLIPRTFKVIP